MTNELAKTESNLPMTSNPNVTEDILSSAIVIPRVLLMQGLSDLVADGKAAMGEMVRSTNGEKLGNPEKPVEFIPLTYNLTWVLTEKTGAKYEYRGQEPLSASNQDLPWEFEKNGTQWKRTKSLNLFALLLSDVAAEKAELAKAAEGEMPDPDKALLPVMVSFRSTSFKAGKDIVTHFAKARKFNLPGHVSVMRLKCAKEKNDMGTFFVFGVENAGKTDKSDFAVCDYWRNTVGSSKAVIIDDETDLGEAKDVSEQSQF